MSDRTKRRRRVNELMGRRVADLRSIAKKVGAAVSGTKAAMIERIVAAEFEPKPIKKRTKKRTEKPRAAPEIDDSKLTLPVKIVVPPQLVEEVAVIDAEARGRKNPATDQNHPGECYTPKGGALAMTVRGTDHYFVGKVKHGFAAYWANAHEGWAYPIKARAPGSPMDLATQDAAERAMLSLADDGPYNRVLEKHGRGPHFGRKPRAS